MTSEIPVLYATAASVGFIHTLLGPDHYVPFVAMSRAGRWSLRKTLAITVLCGVGHVLGSVVLGFAGIFLGIAVFRMESLEDVRGDLAGWMLLGFGLVYLAWGLWRAFRGRPHTHVHVHDDGTVHSHLHSHVEDHLHAHEGSRAASLTPWVLFTIFLFGPCEPLIPILMYPASQGHPLHVALVCAVFGAVTIATMTGVVVAARVGLGRFRLPRLERFGHALAGLVLIACGAAVLGGL
jgi:sulfite exporter TauE/SafE